MVSRKTASLEQMEEKAENLTHAAESDRPVREGPLGARRTAKPITEVPQEPPAFQVCGLLPHDTPHLQGHHRSLGECILRRAGCALVGRVMAVGPCSPGRSPLCSRSPAVFFAVGFSVQGEVATW